jgi:hypothetical protein
MTRVEIAKRIDEGLKNTKLPHVEVARLAKVPPYAVSNARAKTGAVGSFDRLRAIASVVGVKLDPEDKPMRKAKARRVVRLNKKNGSITRTDTGEDVTSFINHTFAKVLSFQPKQREAAISKLKEVFRQDTN